MEKISLSIPAAQGNISSHFLFSKEQSGKLAVIFPGQNNSCEIPALYYPRQLALSEGYDVLCLSITELRNKGLSFNENLKNIASEINKAITECTKQKEYSELVYISRSLGNMISGYQRENYKTPVKKQIYIVPIKPSFRYIQRFGGLIIAGTNDPHYSVEDIRNMKNNENIEVFMVENGNHSLETEGNISKDLANMNEIIEVMKEYLTR